MTVAERTSTNTVTSVSHAPIDNAAFRRSIFDGTVYKVGANAASLRLVEAVRNLVQSELGADFDLPYPACESGRRMASPIQRTGSEGYLQNLLACVGKLKPIIYSDPHVGGVVLELFRSLGFTASAGFWDPVRLRAIAPASVVGDAGLAGPAYALHRDTWYSNPQAQINFWVPLHDVDERQTFAFLHDHFAQHVPNTSERFDYDTWTKEVGFGHSQTGGTKFYPLATDGRLSPADGAPFRLSKGDVLLFSAAHLHGTLPNTSSSTRFSIDFRYVDGNDLSAGIGAPNADSKSTGTATVDYFPLPPES